MIANRSKETIENPGCWVKMFTNRWFATAAIGAHLILVACIYSSWSQYSMIIMRSRIYSYKCQESDVKIFDNIPMVFCKEREKYVEKILFYLVGFELLSALPAGIAYDGLGPKKCAALGALLSILGSTIWRYSYLNDIMPILYCFCSGFACNFMGFAALELKNHFSNASFAISFSIAAQCMSGITSIIIWNVWKRFPNVSFSTVNLIYLFGIVIPLSLLVYLSIPNTVHVQQHEEKPSLKLYKKLIFNPVFAIVGLLSLLGMVLANYWTVIAFDHFGKPIADFLGYINPLQFFATLLFGYLSGHYKPSTVATFMFLCYFAGYSISLTNNDILIYLSAILITIGMSYTYSYKYSQLEVLVPKNTFGVIVGLNGAFSGLGMFFNDVTSYVKNERQVLKILSFTAFLCIIMALYLSFGKSSASLKMTFQNSRVDSKINSSGIIETMKAII